MMDMEMEMERERASVVSKWFGIGPLLGPMSEMDGVTTGRGSRCVALSLFFMVMMVMDVVVAVV